MEMEPKWFNVNEDARIWAGHADAHRMGWLRAPAAILAIDEYEGSYRFDKFRVVGSGSAELDERTTNYPQWWIRAADVSVLPYEEPDEDGDDGDGDDPDPTDDPEGPSDAEIVAAIRVLLEVFWGSLPAAG